jgi:hypothetical protein
MPDEILSSNVPPPTPLELEHAETVVEESAEELEQIDVGELASANDLAVHSILSEERHEEILEQEDNICRRLDQLSSQQTEIASQLADLKLLTVSHLSAPSIPEPRSTPEPTPPVENPSAEADRQEQETELSPAEAPPVSRPKKRRRI